MRNILKVDFFRILKSKLLIATLILIVVTPLIVVLSQYMVSKITFLGPEITKLFSGRSLLYSTYTLSDNLGLLIPVFSGVIVFNDLASGMLRNKIIHGTTRLQIYLSHFICSIIFNIVAMFLYFLITYLLTCFTFSDVLEITKNEILNIVYYILLGTISLVLVASITTFLALNTKSMALLIVLTIVSSIGLNLVTTILLQLNYEKFRFVVYFIPTFSQMLPISINAFNLGGTITHEAFIIGFIGTLVFTFVLLFFGYRSFKKRELK